MDNNRVVSLLDSLVALSERAIQLLRNINYLLFQLAATKLLIQDAAIVEELLNDFRSVNCES